MENWGLITYREKYILFNPEYDSVLNKRMITIVVAHELAHQWVSGF
jgi:aminopeptidase N